MIVLLLVNMHTVLITTNHLDIQTNTIRITYSVLWTLIAPVQIELTQIV